MMHRSDDAECRLGVEWIVDAEMCTPALLRDAARVERLAAFIIDALALHPVGAPLVHAFPGEGGVTLLVLLAESHLTVHTFPELSALTLNLYCCRPRPALDWKAVLFEWCGAREISVRSLGRGPRTAVPPSP